MRRSVVPASLIVLGLALLVGCFYLPTFEEPSSSAKHDFRNLVGDSAGLPIRPGFVDRKTVLLLLGPPPLASADGASIGYLFGTHHGYWVWPLCFAAESAHQTEYGLRLDFGKDDVLAEFKIASDETDSGFFSPMIPPIGKVVAQLNESKPPLLWHGLRGFSKFNLDFGNGLIAPGGPPTYPPPTMPTSRASDEQ